MTMAGRNTLLGVLVQAARYAFGGKAGARREMLETYVNDWKSLKPLPIPSMVWINCYAIQAGREIRILVENEKISDNDAVMLLPGYH